MVSETRSGTTHTLGSNSAWLGTREGIGLYNGNTSSFSATVNLGRIIGIVIQ
jgi:hypothetical protein